MHTNPTRVEHVLLGYPVYEIEHKGRLFSGIAITATPAVPFDSSDIVAFRHNHQDLKLSVAPMSCLRLTPISEGAPLQQLQEIANVYPFVSSVAQRAVDTIQDLELELSDSGDSMWEQEPPS